MGVGVSLLASCARQKEVIDAWENGRKRTICNGKRKRLSNENIFSRSVDVKGVEISSDLAFVYYVSSPTTFIHVDGYMVL